MINIGEMQISGIFTMQYKAYKQLEQAVDEYYGFNDRKYFHQVFQQLTGTTPAKYQQAHS